MRFFKVSLVVFSVCMGVFFSGMVQAQETVRVWGRGNHSNLCQPTMGQFCFSDTEREARRRAESDAAFQCQLKQGQLQTWSLYCRTTCSPMFWNPAETQAVLVNCWSDCDGDCLIN